MDRSSKNRNVSSLDFDFSGWVRRMMSDVDNESSEESDSIGDLNENPNFTMCESDIPLDGEYNCTISESDEEHLLEGD